METGAFHLVDLVTGIIALMLIASLVNLFCQHVKKLPFTIALVIVGIIISALSTTLDLGISSHFILTPELILFVFLPTLIFESALQLDFRQVFWNIWPILFLAIPGLFLSASIIGSLIWLATDFSFLLCLLIGTILSATDPVAVISLFKKLGVPQRLTVLVEGESLFNDATSLVLATLLASIFLQGEFTEGFITEGTYAFLKVFFGGMFIGWSMAVVFGHILGKIHSDLSIEITVTTILAYLSFILAEHYFHVSGIMAVVAAGLTIGSWGRSKISPQTHEFMNHFWEYMAYLANAIIFLMVGMQINLTLILSSIDLIALVLTAMFLSRAIVIYLLLPSTEKLPNGEKISASYQHVMFWGALRGAIALAIVLSLPAFDQKELIINVVMGAVLGTLLIQGLSIEFIVHKLGVDKPGLFERIMRLEGSRAANVHGKDVLKNLKAKQLIAENTAEKLIKDCEKRYHYCENSISRLENDISEKEAMSILYTQCLAREKARYYELFSKGLISETAYRELDYTANDNIDQIAHAFRLPSNETKPSISQLIMQCFIDALSKLSLLPSLVEHLYVKRVIHDYNVAWGRSRAFNSVLKDLDKISASQQHASQHIRKVKKRYECHLDFVNSQIKLVEEQYPEFVETVQYQLSEKFLMIAKQEEVQHQEDFGLIPKGVAEEILHRYQDNIRSLCNFDLSAKLEIKPEELLKKVSFLQNIDETEFKKLAKHLKRITVPKGKKIIIEGERGNAMYLFARGTASVTQKQADKECWLANAYPGDIIGEAALLESERRNATVTSVSPCTIYELNREALYKLFKEYPAIEEAIFKVHKQRESHKVKTARYSL